LENRTDANTWKPVIIAVPFLLVWSLASFFNGRYTWGFDYLQYFPLWFRLVWVVTGSAALVYAGTNASRVNEIFARFAVSKAWQTALLLVVIGLIFFRLRQAIPLLGDGFLRVKEISGGRIFSLTEPLTTMLHGLLYKALSGISHDTIPATWAYASISIAAGLLMVWLYHRVSIGWFQNLYWPSLLLLSGMGLNQIFFGYVESYGLMMAAVAAFIWFGIQCLEGEVRPMTLIMLFSLIVMLHLKGIFLLPALIFIVSAKWAEFKPRLFPAAALSATLALTVLIFGKIFSPAVHWQASLWEIPKQPFLPVWAGFWSYGILSPGHWIDIINQYLLTIPAVIFIGLSQTKKILPRDKVGLFLLLLISGGLAFIVITDPKLGSARDWDLFAWTGIPVFFAVMYSLRKEPDRGRLLTMGAILSLWLSAPWLYLNARPDKSLGRFIRILQLDQRSSSYGYENLAIYFREAGLMEQAEWAYHNAVERAPDNPRILFNYATALSRSGRDGQAAEYYARALSIKPEVSYYWNDYGTALLRLGQYPKAREALERSASLNGTIPDVWYNLGIVYSIQGEWARADSSFSRASDYGFEGEWLPAYWGEAQLNIGQPDKALVNFQRAIEAGVKDSFLLESYRRAKNQMLQKKR